MDNLQKLIEIEKISLEHLTEKDNEELEFLNRIFKNGSSIQSLDIDKRDLALLLTLVYVKSNYSYEELKDMIYRIGDIFRKIVPNGGLTGTLLEKIEMLFNENVYDEVKELVAKDHQITLKERLSKAYMYARNLNEFLKSYGCSNYDLREFLEFTELEVLGSNEKSSISYVLVVIAALNLYFKDKDLCFNKEIIKAINISKNSNKGIPSQLKEINNMIEFVREAYQGINTYYENLKMQEQSKKRSYQKELKALISLEESLPKLLSSSEIKNPSELIKRITNPDIRLETLKLIYRHNIGLYNALDKEYQELSSSSITKYQSLLSKYGISPDDYPARSVMINPLEEVEEMLKQITSLEITNPNEILSIVQKSNLETITALNNQVARGVISKDLYQKNITIFFKDSEEYKNMTANLAFFKESGLNPHYLRNSQELFLMPTKKLKMGFKILEEYNLLPSMKVGMDCSFLREENLDSGIDTLLELGYESFLEQNLSLLNSQDNFKRLRVLKELNIPVTSLEDLEKVLTTDKFLIPDGNIDDYLYNATTYRCPSVELISNHQETSTGYFDSFSETERTYNIAGVILSKNRVQRNLNSIADPNKDDAIIYAATNGSILSDEEYDKILTTIIPNVKGTSKVKVNN